MDTNSQSAITLPGEERRARLLQALAACDDALQYRRPEVTPLDYAATQNNRAALLSEIATLPGEERRARLLQALAATDEALQYSRPEVVPLNYASTQHNRGALLSEIATLPGEERRERLLQALAATDDALQYRRPEAAPLDYASTQNNRALLLSDLASLQGEDRSLRLDQALAAYDEALRFSRPENAPLDYAQTQNNRASLLIQLAALPGKDRRHYLFVAFSHAWEAGKLFSAMQHMSYEQLAVTQILKILQEIVLDGKGLAQRRKWDDLLNLTQQFEEMLSLKSGTARYQGGQRSPDVHMVREARASYQVDQVDGSNTILTTIRLAGETLNVLQEIASMGIIGTLRNKYSEALRVLELAREVDRQTGEAFQLAQWVRDVTGFEFVELEEADEWPPQVAHQMHLAARYERNQDWKAAISAYQQARELLGKAQSDKELARVTEVGFRLALCLKQTGRWTEALKLQEANAAAYKELGDVAGKANAYMEIGHIYQMMNLYDLALLYYGEAYYLYGQFAEEATDEPTRQTAQQGMANAKESLGNLEFQLKMLPKSVADLEDARKLYLDLGRPGKAALITQTLEEAMSQQGGRHA